MLPIYVSWTLLKIFLKLIDIQAQRENIEGHLRGIHWLYIYPAMFIMKYATTWLFINQLHIKMK